MSQSLGNYIGVADAPEEQFGKTMSIPDELIVQWLELATELDLEEVRSIETGLAEGGLHPNATKRRLAREIVALYHGTEAARAAEDHFDTVHRRHEVPDDVPVHVLERGERVALAGLIRDAGLAESGGEARRLIQQGAVKLDGEVVRDLEVDRGRLTGTVLQVGKRKFVRLE